MTECAQCRELLGGYVLGALDPQEVATLERHLASCPRCRREQAELEGLPALLDVLGPSQEAPALPPAELEEAVLDRFARERRRLIPARRPARRRRRVALAIAAVAGAAVVSTAVLALAGVFSSPGDNAAFGSVHLGGKGAAGNAELRAVPAGTGVRLRVRGLPAARSPIYELWCISDTGRWISGGTFRVDRHGRARVDLTSAARPGKYERMLVTRRPSRRGGPTYGPRVLAGRVEY
jgi:Anti-sigma-K factor rskA/Putative zinc-finger